MKPSARSKTAARSGSELNSEERERPPCGGRDGDVDDGGESVGARIVRRAFLKAGLGLVVIVIAVGLIGHFFRSDLHAFATATYDALGVFGLAGIIFLSDSVITPIPPDVVLLILANSPAVESWYWLIPTFGLLSAFAGCCAWWLGAWLGRYPKIQRGLGRFGRNEDLVLRYGAWGVALGALTPIPFSITCWIAGMMMVPFRKVAPVTLLRIPRYVIYYLAILYAERIFSG